MTTKNKLLGDCSPGAAWYNVITKPHLLVRRKTKELSRFTVIDSLPRQVQSKSLRTFNVNPRGGFDETDRNWVIFVHQEVRGWEANPLSRLKVSHMLGFILLVLIGFFIMSNGYAEITGVTLSEVENKVLKNSPLIQKHIEGIGETRAKIDSLDRDYGLYLRSNYRYNLENTLGTPDLSTDFRYRGDIDIEWELFRGLFGNTGEKKSLKKMSEAKQFELKQTVADELAVVRIFFFNALKQKSLSDGDRSALALKEQIFKEVEGLHKKRETLYSELMKVRHEVEKLRSSERQHQRDYDRFINAIAWQTGISGELRLSQPGGMPPSLSLEQLKEKLGSNYLLKFLKLKQQSVEAQPTTSTLFTLSLFGGYTAQERIDKVFQDGLHVGVRLSVPFTIFGKAKAVKNEIEHRAKGLSYEYQIAQQEINRQVDRLYFEYLSDVDLLKLEEQNLQLIDEDIRLMEEYLKNPLHTIKFSNLDLLHKRAEKAIGQAQIEAKQYDLWSDYYKLYKFIEDIR